MLARLGSVCALVLLSAGTAQAIPAFARKYGMSCAACHEAWPKLNDQGIAFRDNGYQWGTGKDSPVQVDPAYWPIALRSAAGYQYTFTNPVSTNAGTQSVGSGRMGYTGVDILMGGTLTQNISFLAVLEPFLTNAGLSPQFPSANAAISSPGETGLMESLWVRFDDVFGTPWINVKIGRGALDLPFDEHRSLTLITNFAAYHYHPGGGANFLPFELGENQFQASLEGHNEGSRTRYVLSLVQGQDDPGSAWPLSSPGGYGHLQHSFYPSQSAVTEVRWGVFGVTGAYPTRAVYQGTPGGPSSGPLFNPDGTAASIVSGTGFAHRGFYQEGVDLSVYLGDLTRPVNLQVAYLVGEQAPDFISGATQEAVYHGGFGELDWTPRLNLTLAGRVDLVRNLQQADPSQPANHLDATVATAALRYTFDIIPRTEAAFHAEASYSTVSGAASTGASVNSLLFFGGVDFVF